MMLVWFPILLGARDQSPPPPQLWFGSQAECERLSALINRDAGHSIADCEAGPPPMIIRGPA